MILVEHLAHVGDVEVVLRFVVPRQFGQPLQVGADDAGLGRLPALILQALEFAQRPLQHLGRHAGGLDLVAQAIRPIALFVAQFLADGFHLLAQHVVALGLLRAVAGVLVNLAANVGDAHFLAQVLQHRLQPRPAAQVRQQLDLGLERQADQPGDVVGQLTGRAAGAGHGHDLLVRLAHQLDVLLQVGDGLQLQGFVNGVLFGQFFVAADDVGIEPLQADETHAAMKLDEHLDADRRAQHVARRGQDGDGENVFGAGCLYLGVALDDNQQLAAALNGCLHRRQRRATANGYRRRDAGENRAPAQGDNGDGLCFVKVAHLCVLCRRLVRNNPQTYQIGQIIRKAPTKCVSLRHAGGSR